MTKTKSKPEAFKRSVIKNPPEQGWRAELYASNSRGWSITAVRMPYYDDELRFCQVDHPDGTASYFTLDMDVEGNLRAGPFGGGYSWAVPKYVLPAVRELLVDAFGNDADEGSELLEESVPA
jgi:hypothetical protein